MTQTTIQRFEVQALGKSSASCGQGAQNPVYLTNREDEDDEMLGLEEVSSVTKQSTRILIDSKRGPSFLTLRYLTTPLHEQAMCYFLQAFGLVPNAHLKDLPSFGLLVKVLDVYPHSQPLQACLAAASLAAFSTRRHCRSLREDASRCYQVALRSVNKAIQSPTGVRSNDTLAAVLALAFYESLTSEDLTGFWYHLQGATAIARHRGKGITQDPMAIGFLKAMSLELVSGFLCSQKGTRKNGGYLEEKA